MSFAAGSIYATLRENANHRSEAETAKFWLHYLQFQVFTDPNMWIVSQEQPPQPYDTQRRIDFLVEYYDTSRVLNIFSVGEAKSGKAGRSEILTVEQQAFDRSHEVLRSTDRDAVWAMTFYGARARLWACRRGKQQLDPVYPLDRERGKKDLYRDIKHHEGDFLKIFGHMMLFPMPVASTVGSFLSWVAGEATMVDDSAAHVTIQAWEKDYCHCLTGDGGVVDLGKRWRRMLVVYQDQLETCYAISDDARNQYWTWTRDV